MSARPIQPIRGPGVIASPLPFSPAIRAGDFLFMSGMASADENGNLVPDTFENEARRTYGNISPHPRRRRPGLLPRGPGPLLPVGQGGLGRTQSDLSRVLLRAVPARTTLIGCLGDLVKYEVDLIAYAGGSEGP